jgi:SAM-dependent methyltransferase
MDAIAARWDARAAQWDQQLQDPTCHLNEDDAYRRFVEELVPIIERHRKFCAGQGVLDAGCGTGLVLAGIVSAFAWGIGVDVSREMIRVAEGKHLGNTRFVVGDCFKLSALCPKAGAVISRGVLLSHYGRQQGEGLLLAAREALVPGGFVVFDFLNQAARGKHLHAPDNKAWFTRQQACELAQAAGFTKATVVGEDGRRVLLLLAEAPV